MNSTLFIIEGWNSWYGFRCSINETVFRQTADALIATGLAAAGYQYGMLFSYFLCTNYYLLIILYSEFGWLLARDPRCSRDYSL